ncbi:CBS domain-containing protein [Kitasatospora sp. NBC_01560]|uniref:CBS domain-containing protein n=1 Tax=Kitasatospora sp. NBC_01560 TaxID=2975965 RepID=UPI00386C91DD
MTTLVPQPVRTRQCPTVADAMDPCEYWTTDDSTVDQANNVLRGAHLEYLIVRDHDGRCEGLVTRAGLRVFLERSWYGEPTSISTVAHQRGPFTWPTMGLALAALTMRIKRLAVWPVVDDDGYVLGVLTCDRATAVLAAAGAATAPTTAAAA